MRITQLMEALAEYKTRHGDCPVVVSVDGQQNELRRWDIRDTVDGRVLIDAVRSDAAP